MAVAVADRADTEAAEDIPILALVVSLVVGVVIAIHLQVD